MSERSWDDMIELLACDVERRPRAPDASDLAPHITGVSREASALAVTFAPEAGEMLEAFVEAERQCCARIGWSVREVPEPQLRIEAGAAALDALSALFEAQDIDNIR